MAHANTGRGLLARFCDKLEQEPAFGCWLWTGTKLANGYGQIRPGGMGNHALAHRASHELFVGPIPPGFQVDHQCNNRACVNPDHLRAVPPRDNLAVSTVWENPWNKGKGNLT